MAPDSQTDLVGYLERSGNELSDLAGEINLLKRLVFEGLRLSGLIVSGKIWKDLEAHLSRISVLLSGRIGGAWPLTAFGDQKRASVLTIATAWLGFNGEEQIDHLGLASSSSIWMYCAQPHTSHTTYVNIDLRR
jgi:hypothetical protein